MSSEPSSVGPILTTSVAAEPTAPATDPTANLRAEIARLQVDNDDLRASAAIWSRLYDAAIQRATELEVLLAGLRNHASPDESESARADLKNRNGAR